MKYPLLTCCALCLVLLRCGSHPPPKESGDWTLDSTTHFRLRAQKGVRSEKDLAAIGSRLEQAQGELLRLLGEDSPQRLRLYFLKDRETLTSYTGFPANGYTDTKKGILYFVDKEPFHLALRHELMHALSWRLWGPPKGFWLGEGLAVFGGGSCGGYPLHALAQAVQRNGKLTPFEALTDTFDFKAIEPSLQGASMVKYLYDRYGAAALKGIWQHGWQAAQRFTGASPAGLEKEWLAVIGQARYRTAIDWDTIKASGCE